MVRGDWTPRPEGNTDTVPRHDDNLNDDTNGPDNTVAADNLTAIKEKALEEISVRVEAEMKPSENGNSMGGDYQMEDLETSFQTLALVPDKIRFGRGGKQRGFLRGGRGIRRGTGSRQEQTHTVAGDPRQHVHDGKLTDRSASDVAPHQNSGDRETINDRAGGNFVAVNLRGRGRGRIYVPSQGSR